VQGDAARPSRLSSWNGRLSRRRPKRGARWSTASGRCSSWRTVSRAYELELAELDRQIKALERARPVSHASQLAGREHTRAMLKVMQQAREPVAATRDRAAARIRPQDGVAPPTWVRHRREDVVVAPAQHLLVPLEQPQQLVVRAPVEAVVLAPLAQPPDDLSVAVRRARPRPVPSPGAVPRPS
jgi:hypothetical protein